MNDEKLPQQAPNAGSEQGSQVRQSQQDDGVYPKQKPVDDVHVEGKRKLGDPITKKSFHE